MSTFKILQSKLDALIPMPGDLPVVYLLGDTGAGKTCFVRQLLGTTEESFPSVRRFRTTVAPTEFIITNEATLTAAFVFKTELEIEQLVHETLETAITDGLVAKKAETDTAQMADLLSESPDQRFRLRCFLNEGVRLDLATKIKEVLIPSIRSWAESNFPGETDMSTVLDLAITESDTIRKNVEELRSVIMARVLARIREVCGSQAGAPIPEHHILSNSDRKGFIAKLKDFLSLDEGSISPALEKARVRGNLKAARIPADLQLVVTDGEGIGHDARESKVLSARHLDYFYASDAIVLVEDAETPFTRGGKGALSSIAINGYLPKLSLAFSRLDRVQTDRDGREPQIREVNQSLRNVLNALREDNVIIQREALDVRYFARMNEAQPDKESSDEIVSLLQSIVVRHGRAKAKFVPPEYDFELLAGFLANSTAELRHSWDAYITGAEAAPWQTQKAFTKRMSWKEDEFRYLKPVAEFTGLLARHLQPFLENPQGWPVEITDGHKRECVERLKQEVQRAILDFVRADILEGHYPEWRPAADLSGRGTTPIRSRMILKVIRNSAPELTGEHAKPFKDALKAIIEDALESLKERAH